MRQQPQKSRSLPEHVRVVVIGAGFAGIGAAVTLTRAGHDVMVLERATSIGGTWRDNRYPGAACDVQSHLYCFSFAPNPRWSGLYPPQHEILAYLHDVVEQFDVGHLIRCGVTVTAARWDEPRQRWQLRTSAGDLTADVLVAAAGLLSEPRLPDLPGLADFGGTVLHSSRWDPGMHLEGQRVAVVGTGASAVQIVPQLARTARELTVFQRTPPWILPRRDRAIPDRRRRRYARWPILQRLARCGAYISRELLVLGLVHRPALLRGVEAACRRHLRRQVPDPALRALLTPRYRAGCKRLLLADDYYPALHRRTVELVPSAVARLEPGFVVAADGTRREVDTVVLATGFEATQPPIAGRIVGRGGRLLSEVWAATGMQALRGTTVHGFPNLFLLVGPNTVLGHTSMIHVIESQLAYLADALRVMDGHELATLEPRVEAQDAWNDGVRHRLAATVWNTGGCSSWYRDARGRLTTLWPGSTLRLRWQTRHLDPGEYLATRRTVGGTSAGPVAGRPARASVPGTRGASTGAW